MGLLKRAEMSNSLYVRGIRQGSYLRCSHSTLTETFRNLVQDSRAISEKRRKPIQAESLLVVLSQDCDIAQQNDEYLEVVDIKPIKEKKVTPLLQKARNYRKLQLPIDGTYYECEAERISIIPKLSLANEKFEIAGRLNDRLRGLLIDWRTSRYNRNPFPDKANQDIFQILKNEASGFMKYLQETPAVIDLYAYISPNEEDQEQYEVILVLLVDENASLDICEGISNALQVQCEALHKADNSLHMLQIDDNWPSSSIIDVPREFVLKPSEFTLKDSFYLRRVTLDYLCYPDLDDLLSLPS